MSSSLGLLHRPGRIGGRKARFGTSTFSGVHMTYKCQIFLLRPTPSYLRNRKCKNKSRDLIPLNFGRTFLSPTHQPETWNDSSVNWNSYKIVWFTKNLWTYTKYCSPSWTLETWPGKRMTVSQ